MNKGAVGKASTAMVCLVFTNRKKLVVQLKILDKTSYRGQVKVMSLVFQFPIEAKEGKTQLALS
jgi:hypothetical protein